MRNLNRAIFYFIQKEIDTPHIGKRIGLNSLYDSYGTGTSNTGRCKVPKPACVHILTTSMLVLSIFFLFNSILIWVGTGIMMTGRIAFPRVQDRPRIYLLELIWYLMFRAFAIIIAIPVPFAISFLFEIVTNRPGSVWSFCRLLTLWHRVYSKGVAFSMVRDCHFYFVYSFWFVLWHSQFYSVLSINFSL